MNKHYSDEYKREIVKRYLCGESISELSGSTGICRSTLYQWIKNTKNKISAKPVEMREYNELKSRCKRQEKIITILKNSPFISDASLHDKYSVIDSLSEEYPVHMLCEALSVSKGSYYNYKNRGLHGNTLASKHLAEMSEVVEKIYHESGEIYGAGKVHAIMKMNGYKVSRKAVTAIMHANGWINVRDGAKKQYFQEIKIKRDLLQQQFNPKRPNEVWVSDVTYFKLGHKQFYICVILDLYSRKAIACRISLKNSTQFVRMTFDEAYKTRLPKEPLIFHTDQGANFTANAFVSHLKELGVTQSFSRPSMPYDNSVMESFFSNMKREELYRTHYHSEKEFRNRVKEYILFYNSQRPHSTIHYQTPDKHEELYSHYHPEFQPT